ncbi:helix-turn-helix domain-containing protein [Cellulomonas sp. SLBN-39]|uniref:helix-turn-helix domain-containing protein n=1 Tax=Cellulomonas sp. SLBN-39 TaxID=2768446 RepID=UPI00114F8FB9|nr:helix-turn-helix transcriptional regulator [Cellulomonas sp. SLBN-39]TQL02285.1 helix-turn-helix protein [Cellulomonas sp. SLBN-39]
MDPRDELRDLLISRRARLTPEQAGITSVGARRVPGLRREEVAMLAGVSTDYYTRLEKGKVGNPSESVLEAVSRALGLDEAEHTHLLDLVRAVTRARPAAPRTRPGGPAPRPSLQWMVDAMTEAVAFVGSPFLDVVAMNHLARALYSPMLDSAGDRRPNFARFAFLDPAARDFYPDWDGAARVSVALLRMAAGQHPRSRALSGLVGELSTRSEDFRGLWAAHEVRLHHAGTKVFHHPVVGDVELSYHQLDLPSDPGHALTVYNAVPGTASADALRLLSAWAATRDVAEVHGTA